LDCSFEGPKPEIHQPENWLLDGSVWKLHAKQDVQPPHPCETTPEMSPHEHDFTNLVNERCVVPFGSLRHG
jgi:hypothetical protein